MLFTLKKYLGGMMLPLPLLLMLIAFGIALLWFSRFQKTGKACVSIGWLVLALLSLQPVADSLLKPIEETRLEKTLIRLRQERTKQDVSVLPENQQALKFIPCSGHSRIYLLQMDDVAFVSSRMSGVFVTSSDGKEGFTELTLRTLESRTPLLRCHRQFLVNMAQLQEIRLEDNGQAELILRNGLTVPVSRRYLKSLKEAIGL